MNRDDGQQGVSPFEGGLLQPVQQQSRATYLRMPIWKRALDLLLVLVGLLPLVPVILLVGLTILLVSGRPVFFRQQRIGYAGKPFTMWKFRTMQAGADPSLHREYMQTVITQDLPVKKLDATGDPRLIPLGATIRAAALDEIPQVVNVLLGSMSLVGPRPCMDYEYRHIPVPFQRRFLTPPGMTGLWQIRRTDETSFEQMLEFDLRYVANRSLWLDSLILLKTLPAVISQIRARQGGHAH